MSSTIMLMFEKGEVKKVREWFDKVCPADMYPELPVPVSEFREDIERGIYVTFKRNIMELDVAIWDDMAKCFATHIGQELNKVFKIKQAGWDSVGYCTEDFMESSGLLSWLYKENLEKRREGMTKEGLEFFEKDIKFREDVEKFYRKKAQELVNKGML